MVSRPVTTTAFDLDSSVVVKFALGHRNRSIAVASLGACTLDEFSCIATASTSDNACLHSGVKIEAEALLFSQASKPPRTSRSVAVVPSSFLEC